MIKQRQERQLAKQYTCYASEQQINSFLRIQVACAIAAINPVVFFGSVPFARGSLTQTRVLGYRAAWFFAGGHDASVQ
jgi:hypothetical protein